MRWWPTRSKYKAMFDSEHGLRLHWEARAHFYHAMAVEAIRNRRAPETGVRRLYAKWKKATNRANLLTQELNTAHERIAELEAQTAKDKLQLQNEVDSLTRLLDSINPKEVV